MRIRLVHLFILILIYPMSLFSGEWVQRLHKDGITVWTRDVEGSDFKETRAQMQIQSRLFSVLSLLADSKSQPEWYPSVLEIRTLKTFSPMESYIYQLTELPFPFQNRDVVVRSLVKQDAKTKTISIQFTVVNDFYPIQPNYVRITKAHGSWKFQPVGKDSVIITYQMFSEPNGTLPAWVTNWAVEDRPMEILKKLRKKVKEEKYKNATFPGLKEP